MTEEAPTTRQVVRRHKKPLYPVLLQLKNVHPNAWQRAALGEGMALLGALLALADVASAWSIVVLPLAVAVVVKAHDLLAGLLRRTVESGGAATPEADAEADADAGPEPAEPAGNVSIRRT